MDRKQPDYLKGLKEIRNAALLLGLGCAYLCEVPFLKKIGLGIHSQIDALRGDIRALKKRFPGKFAHEIDTDDVLEEIRKMSLWLQNPDQALGEKCTIGELGRELEGNVEKLSSSIGSIRDQVEGEGLSYTKKDSFLNLFGVLSRSGSHAASGMAKVMKVLAGLALLFGLVFAFLFITMEKEKDVRGIIASKKAQIRSQEEIIDALDQEKQQILEQSEALQKDDLSRQDKVAILELDMKIHELDERQQQAEVQIRMREKEIQQQEEKIEEMKRKSFLQRLLRR